MEEKDIAQICESAFSDKVIRTFEANLYELDKKDTEYEGVGSVYRNCLTELKKIKEPQVLGVLICAIMSKVLPVSAVLAIVQEEEKFISKYIAYEMVSENLEKMINFLKELNERD